METECDKPTRTQCFYSISRFLKNACFSVPTPPEITNNT